MSYFPTVKAAINDLAITLKNLVNAIVYPPWYDRSANQIKAQITLANFSQTIGTVTTVTTVSSVTNVDGYQGKLLMINMNNAAWSEVVRRVII